MFGSRISTVGLLLATLVVGGDVRSDDQARQADAVGVKTFTRAALLRRFDRNRDNKLNDSERLALQKAFDGP